MDCRNALETCRQLWNLQKKLQDLLSQYGECLETLRINPYHRDAQKSVHSLVDEITDIGKHQNSLMKVWADSVIQLSEKYSSNKSILLEKFKDVLIRQLWNNDIEQCNEEIEDDAVKVLFLNQINLVPGSLDKYLCKTNDMVSKSVDVGNLRVSLSVDQLQVSNNDSGLGYLESNKGTGDSEKLIELIEVEPRCTRSSKVTVKRNNDDNEVLTKAKLRRKMLSLTKTPNTCCSLCKKLIHMKEDNLEENGKIICCNICNDKYYTTITVTSQSSSNNDEPVTPSDASSPNDASLDTSHSNHS